MALAMVVGGAAPAAGQGGGDPGRAAYFGAVAEFFGLPASEVAILGEARLPAQEIPVVLFVARRAGISPEAVVALRGSGQGWTELARRYGLDAAHFHVPLPDGASAGRLGAAYGQYRATPTSRWGEVRLTEDDIVSLVNVRVLAQTLRRSPADVLAAAESGSWLEVYRRLIGTFP